MVMTEPYGETRSKWEDVVPYGKGAISEMAVLYGWPCSKRGGLDPYGYWQCLMGRLIPNGKRSFHMGREMLYGKWHCYMGGLVPHGEVLFHMGNSSSIWVASFQTGRT